MKKIVLASVIALAVISLVSAPTLRAQDQSTITIKDPAEYNAYSQATTQADPKAKAAAMESFLQTYPQSVVKADVLNMLVDTYQQLGDLDHALSAASRLLQLDAGNFKAILISVAIKKSQCQKAEDPKTGVATDPTPCDDAAALAQKGLTAAKPAATSADDWKKQTAVAYPIFHSAIALDDAAAKKDFKAAEAEYSAELMLYTDDQSKSAGLQDSLLLAQAYGAPGPGQDLVKAVWFYARVWDFAPPAYKTRIEPTLEYLYKKYHGALDGLDAIKTQAATTTFPPGTLIIKPAATPQEKIHAILETTPDLTTLALADKELVLSYGAKDDADKLWALMKDKDTPVPGIVIEATASVIKIAVTDDAKRSKIPDFIVNLKTPLTDKEIPQPGFEYGLSSKNQAELDGTYDSYTQIPATDTVPQSAQIVLRDGAIVPVKKAPVHKPAAGHRPAAH
jgi:tetratricopeptide (TPR) repeat protein